jgi:hypothetical protein
MAEQQDYLEFLIDECEEYIKEFEQLKETVLGEGLDLTEGSILQPEPKCNSKYN